MWSRSPLFRQFDPDYPLSCDASPVEPDEEPQHYMDCDESDDDLEPENHPDDPEYHPITDDTSLPPPSSSSPLPHADLKFIVFRSCLTALLAMINCQGCMSRDVKWLESRYICNHLHSPYTSSHINKVMMPYVTARTDTND